MKIEKIKIKNFRSLKNFCIDLEDELSLIVGKNNTGKTSVIEILNKFLNKNSIESEDFNIEYIKELENNLLDEEYEFKNQGIQLKIFIKYNETDNLSNISKFLTTLDINNNYIILDFEYILNEENFSKIKNEFIKFINENSNKDFEYFFKHNYKKYFEIIKRSLEYDMGKEEENEEIYIAIENDKEINNLINMRYISEKRAVDNKETNNTLSVQSASYYEKIKDKPEMEQVIAKFRTELEETDKKFDEEYESIFENVLKKVKEFGGVKKDDLNIKIKSLLQQSNILKGNTTVFYNYNGELNLPENYNGLGYLNLISIIFEIENIINDFSKEDKKADINLLFIEEPEAHTHPQMQYIFINNIKGLLEKSAEENKINLQTIITTHSSHIVSQSNFNDIKYFNKSNEGTWCKNLKDLEKLYESDEKSYRFLKQYLTLNRAEIFFADKIIFIEGDTERILLPAMLKKIDLDGSESDEKLLSQNISIIEVGRHSKIFQHFLNFLQIKTLIITDIDSTKKKLTSDGKTTYVACSVDDIDAIRTSNDSIKYFFDKYIENDDCLDKLKSIKSNDRIIKKVGNNWKKDKNGNIMVQYQLREENVDYYPRSFEDAFICINGEFIKNNEFTSLKNKKIIETEPNEYYKIAENCIDSKPSFAIEILLNSNEDYSNWNIPSYIKEGLEWLKK